MLIPITSEHESGIPEWALVELQGRTEPLQEWDLREPLHVGTLQLSRTNKDIVQLQVGYHILEGRKVTLKKPLAILETVQQGSSGSAGSSEGSGSEGSSGDGSSSSRTHCKVVGVLRAKYLFKTRPKALISKPMGR